MRFERLGVFQYSHEEGTSGYDLVDDVTAEMKVDRANRLMAIQQEISEEINSEKIGKTFKVLVDRKEGDSFYGRTVYDSPEVDNEVIIDATKDYVRLGDFVDVHVVDSMEYDLIGEVVK